MANLSQDLQKLHKEAKATEQKLRHQNAELLAGHQKLKQLDTQFQNKTIRLLKEQKAQLDEQSNNLKTEIKITQDSLDDLKGQAKTELAKLGAVRDDIAKLVPEYEKLKQAIQQAEDGVVELQTQKHTIETETATLKEEIKALQQTKSRLIDESTDAEQLAEQKKLDLANLGEQFATRQAEYDSEKTNREEKIAILDAKLLEKAQQLKKQTEDDDLMRQTLASWQKTLEERDQNLRIREAKVEVGEGKLVQNSNLMNL